MVSDNEEVIPAILQCNALLHLEARDGTTGHIGLCWQHDKATSDIGLIIEMSCMGSHIVSVVCSTTQALLFSMHHLAF